MIQSSLRSERNKLEGPLSFYRSFFYCSLMRQKGMHILEASIGVLLYLFALGIEGKMILIDGASSSMLEILISKLISLPH